MTNTRKLKVREFLDRQARQKLHTQLHGDPKVSDDVHPYEPEGGDKSLMSLREIDHQMEDSFQRLRGVDPT